MKVKVIPVEEIQTKKGKLIYRCLYKENGAQKIVNILGSKKKELNKETDIEVSFGNLWFEK